MLKSAKQFGHEESGVTLLLSVLIMSALFLITVTVAALTMQEIRAVRSSTLTEPAIIAAESAGEQGIFLYTQTGSINTVCAGNANTSTLSGACADAKLRVSKAISYGPAVFKVTPGTPLEFFMYDPTDPNGNLTMTNNLGQPIYTSLVIRRITGNNSINIDIDTLDGVGVASATLNPGAIGTYNTSNIVGSSDKRMAVVITANTTTATIEISTTGVYAGIPDFPTVQAEACAANSDIANCNPSGIEVYRRRLDITLPK